MQGVYASGPCCKPVPGGYSDDVGARLYLLAGLLAGLVLLAVVIAVTPFGAPRPLPASAPATAFSSERAMDLLRQIAVAPRPIASDEAGRVRDLIYDRLRQLGLGPHVLASEIVSARDPRVAGVVHNVAGRLPGRDTSRAVLLMAHYDTVPTAPGAADDGSGVAALLEVARALRAGPPPRNDVIFLFTDGEERGLLGAQAFLRDDSWAFGTAVVLNFDSAGSSSPALMYETSPGNGLLVRELVDFTQPYTSSLMYEVSRRQPIISDFRAFLARGIPGMSFGMLDGPGLNHTAYDSLDAVGEASLQHEGETALTLSRRLGDRDLWNVHRPDVVAFDVVASQGVVYPAAYSLPLAVVAAALFAAALVLAARRRLLSAKGIVRSVVGTAVALGLSLLGMAIVWTMYSTAYEERVWSDTGVVISDWYRLGLVLLAAALVLAIYALLLRRLRAWDLAVAGLGWWLAGAAVVTYALPQASYLLTWPLAGGALGLAAAVLLTRRRHETSTAHVGGTPQGAAGTSQGPADAPASAIPTPGAAAACAGLAGAVPGLLLLSSATYLLLMSAGLKQVVTVLCVWSLAGLLVLPLALVTRAFRLWFPAALAVAGVVVLFAAGSTVAFDSEHPKFTSVYYRQGADGAAVWQTLDPLDDYTRRFLTERLSSPFVASYFPTLGTRDTLAGGAPRYGLRPPSLRVLSDSTEDDRRTVRLRLRSRRDAAVVSVLVHTVVGYLTASVDGQRLAGRDTTLLDGTTVRWSFDFYAPPPEGVVVTLRCAAGPALLLRAVDFSYGLPDGAAGHYPPRPAGMLPGRIGDGTITETVLRLKGAKGAASP
jgi:hypothetical protein